MSRWDKFLEGSEIVIVIGLVVYAVVDIVALTVWAWSK